MTPNGPRRPTAAVTGASRGIGRATALELARHGYRVFALARSEPELEALTIQATEAGLEIEPVVLDIADEESRSRAVATIIERTQGYGLDVLVNNAGYAQLGPIEEIPLEKLRRQFEVNVFGLLAFTQPFLPFMRERRRGRIVNVGSIAGRISTPFMGAYSASKYALEAINDAMRLELSPFGVHVILIAPGPIASNFGQAAREMRVGGPGSPYGKYLSRSQRARQGSDWFGRPAESVSRVIVRAVQSRHPRLRYTITIPAMLGALSRRLVPDTVVDWAFRIAMGLHRR
jgi:short-subunit dehydrogenase